MISAQQLFIVIVIVAGLWLFRTLRVRQRRQRQLKVYQGTVRCQRCGAYLPPSQAAGNAQEGYHCQAGCSTSN